MRCTTAKKWASDYVDGNLADGRRDRFERHVKSCSDCRKLVHDFQRIVERARDLSEPSPPHETWGKILARLEEDRKWAQIPAFAGTKNPPFSKWSFALGAASVLLVAAGAVLLGPGLGSRSGLVSQLDRQQYTLDKLEEAESHYQKAIKALAQAVAAQEDQMDAGLAEVFKANLEIVNASIAECKQAVLNNPLDLESRRFLLAAYQEKADLLDKLLNIKDRSSPSGMVGTTL
jgi:anti-sigma factor RsiW